MNRHIKRALKVILWIITGIIMLVIAVLVFLNTPLGQSFVKNKVIKYLKVKTNTEISLEKLRIGFPREVELTNFFIADQKKDTLLYAGKLLVDIDMIAALSNRVELDNIELQKVRANIYRKDPDTVFNYQFLVDSLLSNQKKSDADTSKDNASALKLDLDKIIFNDVRLTFKDDVIGNDAGIFIGKLDAKVNKFDLNQMHYVLEKFALSNTGLLYGQKKPLTVLQQSVDESIDKTEKEQGGRLPLIEFKNFSFDNVNLNYDDRLSDTRAVAAFKEVAFKNLLLDITHGKYKSTYGSLNNSVIDFAYRPTAENEAAIKKAADSTKESSFSLYLDNIVLNNNNIRYTNLSSPRLQSVLDYNHLNITELGITGKDIVIDSSGIKAMIAGAKLKDSSGFVLSELKGNFIYDDEQLRVDNFLLKTPQTFIDNTSTLTYTSREDLSKNPQRVKMAVNFRNSQIHMKDIHYLSHTIPVDYRSEKLNLTAALTGYLNDLHIDKFQLNGLRNTKLNIAGNIKGLPDMKRTLYNIDIRQLQTSKRDVQVFVPKKSLPSNITLPNHIAANGKFKGSTTNFVTNFNLRTDMGAAKLDGKANLAKGSETYSAKINLSNFNLGRLLQQKDVGRVTMVTNVNGSGLEAKRINAKINGTIYNAVYNGYNYKNIKLDGSYARQTLVLKANSTDPNADFNLTAKVGIGGKNPAVKGVVDLKQIDLQKLNFVKDELKLAGLATVDFTSVNPDYLNGEAFITSLQVVKNGQTFNLDTVALNAFSSATENRLDLHSEILTANVKGKYQLTQIGQAFINEINKYYEIGKVKKIPDQRMAFDIAIHDTKMIQNFVPQLTSLAPAAINGLIDTQQDSLLLKGNFPQVIYDSFNVKNIVLDINNRRNTQLDYALNIKSFESPSIQLYNSEVSGAAANNQLGVNVFLRDSKDKDKYVLGGNFKVNDGAYQFSLHPDKLLLNYDKWQVAPDNLIQYGKGGVHVQNFTISNSGQSFSVNSLTNTPNAPIQARFTNFMLETLTRYAEQDTAMVGGLLNGTVDAKDVASNPKFEADLTVDKLRYKKDQLGNAAIKVNNNTANAFQTDIAFTGIHDVKIDGYYYTLPSSSLDMNIAVNKIDLKHIESITEGQIRNGSGILTGNLTAKGAAAAPQILGHLTFKDAGLNIAKLNSYFRLQNETINFRRGGIAFNNFTLRDSLNQPLTVNGMVRTQNYRDYAFDLDIRATNFNAMNSTEADNNLFYGKVFFDLTAKVSGDLNKPEADMRLRINKDTKFSFVIPENNPGVIEQEGVVEFIDKDAPPYNGRVALNIDSLTRSSIRGMDISGDISIDKDAEITIIVDPQNGDALTVKGEADLSVQLDPSGKTTVTGRYELSDGSYNLTIGGLAKREFKIQQGSSIQWTGAPTEANVDLTAIYNVNTSPMDLVADQMDGLDYMTRTTFRQKIPFFVYLKMKGELLKPIISFQLDMPENERNAFNGIVYTRLQQVNSNESELNKQVFALLALNRFISDNPFQSLAGGATVSSIARQSVSKLLTEQLNNLASDLIHGVDINFELTSGQDYSTGTEQNKTDLEVAFSKKLLNDRLIVSVGNNFALEGAQTNNQQTAQFASNVNIEYLLSRDGRYRLRAYRRNQTEGIIEGQIIETGIGFTMVVDYNRFREVFNSFKKRSERRRQR